MKKVKKWLALGMTAVLSFALLASCASSAASSTAEETSAAETTLKAAMITPQKLGDDGPIDACYAGLQDGAEAFGYESKVLEPESGEFEDAIRSMCDELEREIPTLM